LVFPPHVFGEHPNFCEYLKSGRQWNPLGNYDSSYGCRIASLAMLLITSFLAGYLPPKYLPPADGSAGSLRHSRFISTIKTEAFEGTMKLLGKLRREREGHAPGPDTIAAHCWHWS